MTIRHPEQDTGIVHGPVKRGRTAAGQDRLEVHPGGLYFGPADKRAHTLLGSCISIVLDHAEAGLAGISHFVVADSPPAQSGGQANGRYAADVLWLFASACRRYGVSIEQCQARIFGGSNMLMSRGVHRSFLSDEPVGDRNAARAFELLTAYRVPIRVADVGESGYRRLIFDMPANDVWVKRVVGRTSARSVAIGCDRQQGDVEYF